MADFPYQQETKYFGPDFKFHQTLKPGETIGDNVEGLGTVTGYIVPEEKWALVEIDIDIQILDDRPPLAS